MGKKRHEWFFRELDFFLQLVTITALLLGSFVIFGFFSIVINKMTTDPGGLFLAIFLGIPALWIVITSGILIKIMKNYHDYDKSQGRKS